MTRLERVIARDRTVALVAVLALSGLAWLELWRQSQAMRATAMPEMPDMPGMTGMMAGHELDLPVLALMWSVMMVAMMLPSATPLVLLFAKIQRERRATGARATPVAVFMAGYLLVWTGWSLGVAVLQWYLQSWLPVSGALARSSWLGAGLVLLLAGLYQLTPLKTRCLIHCQSPLGFLLTQWREGRAGALVMGVRHGAYCVGCCWALMGLLFVGGVMNLLWVAVIAGYVLIEKSLRTGPWLSRAVGGALVGLGVAAVVVALATRAGG